MRIKTRPTLISLLLEIPMRADRETDEHIRRIQDSAAVLSEIMQAGEPGIPADLFGRAQCVGVVPDVKRAGFIVGPKHGIGVLTCRTHGPTGWSAVSTIRMEGASVGFRIGSGKTHVVFAIMNEAGVNKLMSGKFTLGGDALVMAGPVGRFADATAAAIMGAEVLAWSRARGVFSGVSLQGATLSPDDEENAKIYSQRFSQRELLGGGVAPPASAVPLYAELNQFGAYTKQA